MQSPRGEADEAIAEEQQSEPCERRAGQALAEGPRASLRLAEDPNDDDDDGGLGE